MSRLLIAVILLVTACSPQRQIYHSQAPEERAKFVADIFYQPDDAPLPYRVWEPKGKRAKKNPKAVIIALHGFNDYSRAFETAGPYFSEHGFVMYAYDQRGFGAAPYTGIWAGEDNLIHDLANFVRKARERHPDAPLYILGESMGGAVAIIATSTPDFPKVDGVVLVAPAVWGEDTMNPIYRMTLWMAAHTMPSYKLTGSDLKILASNNIPMLQRMSRDPMIIKSTRVDAIYGIVKLMDRAFLDVPKVNVPVLMVYGSDDQVIPQGPIERALERFNQPVQYVYYPGSYHMMLRDIQGEVVMADIASWIEHPGAPMPSGNTSAIVRAPAEDMVAKNAKN
jgi:alpha-beta hydrolase superfamily lysophospholipase